MRRLIKGLMGLRILKVSLIHSCVSLGAFGYLKRVIVTPAVYPHLKFITLTFRATLLTTLTPLPP